METKKSNIGLTYGLISGLASVIFSVVLYLGGVKWFVHPIAYSGFIISIVIAVIAGIKLKKSNGGYLEFADALKVVFTTFVISTLIGGVFSYLLFNVIDVPFREALTQETIEKTQQWMTNFKVPQEQIDKTTEEMAKGNNYTIGKQSLGIAFLCIFWFIISVIIAAIIKKKKPAFPSVTQ